MNAGLASGWRASEAPTAGESASESEESETTGGAPSASKGSGSAMVDCEEKASVRRPRATSNFDWRRRKHHTNISLDAITHTPLRHHSVDRAARKALVNFAQNFEIRSRDTN